MISGVGLAIAKTMASGAIIAAISRGQRTGYRSADEKIGAAHRLGQTSGHFAGIGLLRQCGLMPCKPGRTAGYQDAMFIHGDDVLRTGRLEHFDNRCAGSARGRFGQF